MRTLKNIAWTLCIATAAVAAEPPEHRLHDEAAATETPVDASDREHWSYQPLQPSPLPAVTDAAWSRTAIDRFIIARLEDENLHPQGEASRRNLIRRLSYDLLGLPPTAAEIERFVQDRRPGAYPRLVDRYLASPRHGEHVAQFWLDLAKFAETDGFEHDNVRPRAWQYRDWVVASLNAGMPYDQFLSHQIAGDLLQPDDDAARIATAFGLCGPDMPDINSQDERLHHVLNDLTAAVGEVVLGLQLGCAKCHDHKYDAISQADFYRLRAIFESSVQVQRNKSLETLRGDPTVARTTRLWQKGDWRRPGPRLNPGFPRILNPTATRPSELAEHPRVALARWLTSQKVPITARVIVNRVWQMHFGRGLSDTSSDFGVVGEVPSHPELLDYLARDLQRDWSLKRLQRQIVLSSVYRQAGRPPEPEDHDAARTAAWEASIERDPDGTLLSRFPRQRIRAEVVRDAMLVAADQMVWKQGGPGVRPPLPEELKITLLRKQWDVTEDPSEHYRRSIYVFARRNLRYPIFEAFDRPEANASCSKRSVSTTAPQALFMMNSQFAWTLAEQLAQRVQREASSPPEQVSALFRHTLGREPSPNEQRDAAKFLGQGQAGLSPLTELALVLFNCNEFYYVD